MMKTLCITTVIICAYTISAIVAQADEAVAIILDVEGDTSPAAEAFDELVNGARIDLGSDARVVFSDYQTCGEYNVVGGVIEIENNQIALSRNTHVNFSAASCVASITLSDADLVSAGVVTRASAGDMPEISNRPSFGIPGPASERYDSVTVMIDSKSVLTLSVVNGRALLPDDTASLTPGKEAVVLISGANTQQRAVRVRISDDAAAWTILK